MTSPVSPSETIAKAMEGVTPGPWLTHGAVLGHKGDVFAPTAKRVTDCHHIARCFAPKPEKQIICELQAIQLAREAASVSEANAAYIAACSPDRMREVLDELYALRETALRLEAMDREMAELRGLLSRAEEYIIDGVTNAKADAEMSAAYPSRATRYNAALEEVRQLHADVSHALSTRKGSAGDGAATVTNGGDHA